jgi:hypothetical protein
MKLNSEGGLDKFKSRLIVRGYKRHGASTEDTSPPSVYLIVLNMFLADEAKQECTVHSNCSDNKLQQPA